MNLSPFKKQMENDRDAAEALRKIVLADPEKHGLRGSLSDGINKERMVELARQIEEREKSRFETARKENSMPRMGVARKDARPFPKVLTTRWVYSARRAELEKLLLDNGRPFDESLSIIELRKVARSLIPSKARRRHKEDQEKKAGAGITQKPSQSLAPDDKIRNPEIVQSPTSGEIIEIKAPCICCGRISLWTLRDRKIWRIEIL